MASRRLELTADADVWGLMSFEIRNYHWRWGDRVSMTVLPHERCRIQRSAVAACVFHCSVRYCSCRWCRMVRARRSGRCANAIDSGHRSALLDSARGDAGTRRGIARARRHRYRAADLRSCREQPEFFPARSTPPATIVATVLAICVGLPLALLALERAIRVMSGRAAAAVSWLRYRVAGGRACHAVVSKARCPGLSMGCVDQRAHRTRCRGRLQSHSRRSAIPDGASARGAGRSDPVSAQSGCETEFHRVRIGGGPADTLERTPPIVRRRLRRAADEQFPRCLREHRCRAVSARWCARAGGVLVPQCEHRLVHHVVCGACDRVGAVLEDGQGRADAAVLPRQPVHRTGTSLQHFRVDAVSAIVSTARVSTERGRPC